MYRNVNKMVSIPSQRGQVMPAESIISIDEILQTQNEVLAMNKMQMSVPMFSSKERRMHAINPKVGPARSWFPPGE